MNKLLELRKKRGVFQKDIAAYLQVDRTTYVKYERGDSEPNIETLRKLANYFNVSLDYLLNGEETTTDKNYISVPVYGRIPAGIATEAIEDILDYEDIPKEWCAGDKEYFSLQIKGDSMFPAYQDGDRVIFQKSATAETGDDAAVMVNGDDATFKRIERSTAGVILKPLNPAYESKFYSNDEIEALPIRILGIAKELRRNVKR